MSEPRAILSKMASCKPYYDRLIELSPEAAKGSTEDWRLWSMVERNLQLALECAIDVGEMLISWKGWELAEENRDVFRILGARGVLSHDLAARMMSAAGLRNALVHRYGAIDVARVRHAVLHDLPDLDAFAREVARFVAGAV